MIVLFCANRHHESDRGEREKKCSKHRLLHLQINKGKRSSLNKRKTLSGVPLIYIIDEEMLCVLVSMLKY